MSNKIPIRSIITANQEKIFLCGNSSTWARRKGFLISIIFKLNFYPFLIIYKTQILSNNRTYLIY